MLFFYLPFFEQFLSMQTAHACWSPWDVLVQERDIELDFKIPEDIFSFSFFFYIDYFEKSANKI